MANTDLTQQILAGRINAVQARVKRAAYQASCSHKTDLIAVSKTVSPDVIRAALDSGQRHFGENRVQEAAAKWTDLKKHDPDIRLHLIGPLQTNKIKSALKLFDVIQTLDRPRLAGHLARIAAHHRLPLPEILIQVNTGEETQKAGVAPHQADQLIDYCLKQLSLPVSGLMTIPPLKQLGAPHFALLARIAKRHNLHHLSMGMSDDFEQAVMLGATYIRVGRAIFGSR